MNDDMEMTIDFPILDGPFGHQRLAWWFDRHREIVDKLHGLIVSLGNFRAMDVVEKKIALDKRRDALEQLQTEYPEYTVQGLMYILQMVELRLNAHGAIECARDEIPINHCVMSNGILKLPGPFNLILPLGSAAAKYGDNNDLFCTLNKENGEYVVRVLKMALTLSHEKPR